MDYHKALALIRAGHLKPLYLIYGDEPLLAQSLLLEMKSRVLPALAMEQVLYFVYDAEEVSPEMAIGEIKSGAFFGEHKLCVVKNLRPSAKRALAEWEAALEAYAKNPNPSAIVVVVLPEEPDSSDPLRAAFMSRGEVVSCSRLKGKEIARWAQAYSEASGKKVSPGASWALESMSGPSLAMLQNEMDKLFAYVGNRQTIQAEDVAAVCQDASEVKVFAVTDAIIAGRGQAAVAALERVLSAGEQPLRALSYVANNFRLIAKAAYLRQRGTPERDLAKELGGHPFVANKAVQASRKLDQAALMRAYESILEADEGLKSGRDPVLALSSLLFELAGLFQR